MTKNFTEFHRSITPCTVPS